MLRRSCFFVLLVVAVTVATPGRAGGARTLTMYTCRDAVHCDPATCRNQTIFEGVCLTVPGANASSFILRCEKPPTSRCANAGRYADAACTDLVSMDQAVCSTCSMGVEQKCTRDAVFGAFDCAFPATCGGNCTGHKRFPLQKCVPVAPIVDPFVPGPFIKVLRMGPCTHSIVFDTAYATGDCTGAPTGTLTFQERFCMNHAGVGYMYECNGG